MIGKFEGNYTTDVAEIEGLTAMHVVEGYVWCTKLDVVHSDTLNPDGYAETVPSNNFCKPEDHEALFMDSEHHVKPRIESYRCDCECHRPAGWTWKEGDPRPLNLRVCGKCSHVKHMSDEWQEPIEPMPVRSAPVPLTVRRHTPESRAIWRQNLVNALPQDMLVEDRFKIADQLLEVAITTGNELRRKRLIDKLMTAAEEMEDRPPNRITRQHMTEWSDLMQDASEEIRSFL